VVIAAVGSIAVPSTATVHRAPCAEAEALEHLGRLDAAETAYLHQLGTATGVRCAQQGLARLGRRTESCAYAAALKSAGERTNAHAAYLKVLAADPASSCARAGVSQTATTTSVWSWLGSAAPNAGKALAAAVLAVLLLTLVVLTALQVQTRVPWLRDIWPARTIRRPTMQIASLDDSALNERLGPAVAGLIRGRVSWRKDRFGVNLVSGQAGVATALSGLGDVSSEAKAAVAVIDVLTSLLPRRRFVLTGELQPASDEGPGISLELSQQSGFEALITFWARPLAVKNDATAAEVYRALAVAAAAWVDHWTAKAIGGGDLLTGDPQSWAVFRCGLDAQRLGDEERARVLYDRALVMDGTNVGALANLGVIYRRRNEYEDSRRNLRRALKATQDPKASPKLKRTLNPDWYRIKYQLAALYTNWAAATPSHVRHNEHANRALQASVDLARQTLEAIIKPPSAGIRESASSGFVEESLLPFLEGTIEPSALTLVACSIDPIPPAPEQRPEHRPDREAVLANLASPSIDPWQLIAYVEMGEHVTPSAHFDLACFYTKIGKIAKATKRLQRAIRETAEPERKGLIAVVEKDPLLKRLREVRPGLIPKLELEFIADCELDDESLKLVKQFNFQTRAYKAARDASWTVSWLPESSRFAFDAEQSGDGLLIALADTTNAVTEDDITMIIGAREAHIEDHPAVAGLRVVRIWILLHQDAPEHQCDKEQAASRGVEIRRIE
jgi:tetratricopeptide (TPR) repeat protein